MRSELTETVFDNIIDHLSNSPDNLHSVLEKYDTTSYMFYKLIGSDQTKADRYMQARSKYVENKLSTRSEIMEKAIKDAKINPKCANALIAAAKEQCRIIEWDCEKLLPKIYGSKIDVGDGSLKIVMVNQNVSNNQISSTTNDNDKITVE